MDVVSHGIDVDSGDGRRAESLATNGFASAEAFDVACEFGNVALFIVVIDSPILLLVHADSGEAGRVVRRDLGLEKNTGDGLAAVGKRRTSDRAHGDAVGSGEIEDAERDDTRRLVYHRRGRERRMGLGRDRQVHLLHRLERMPIQTDLEIHRVVARILPYHVGVERVIVIHEHGRAGDTVRGEIEIEWWNGPGPGSGSGSGPGPGLGTDDCRWFRRLCLLPHGTGKANSQSNGEDYHAHQGYDPQEVSLPEWLRCRPHWQRGRRVISRKWWWNGRCHGRHHGRRHGRRHGCRRNKFRCVRWPSVRFNPVGRRLWHHDHALLIWVVESLFHRGKGISPAIVDWGSVQSGYRRD